jgi:hypothetical protein
MQHARVVRFTGRVRFLLRRGSACQLCGRASVGVQGLYPEFAIQPGKQQIRTFASNNARAHGWSTTQQAHYTHAQKEIIRENYMQASAVIASAQPAAAMPPKGDTDIPMYTSTCVSDPVNM